MVSLSNHERVALVLRQPQGPFDKLRVSGFPGPLMVSGFPGPLMVSGFPGPLMVSLSNHERVIVSRGYPSHV